MGGGGVGGWGLERITHFNNAQDCIQIGKKILHRTRKQIKTDPNYNLPEMGQMRNT